MTCNQSITGKRAWLRLFGASLIAGILYFGSTAPLRAQTFGFIPAGPGIQLDSVSVNAAYNLLPTPTAAPQVLNTLPQQWDLHAGVALAVGWSKAMEHGSLSAHYDGGYGRRVLLSNSWDLYNTARVGYNYSTAIKPRITYGIDANALFTDFESYFLSPAGASATVGGTQSTGSLTPGFTVGGTLPQNAAAQAALFGGRVLTSTVSNNISFAKSTRLSYNFTLAIAHSQRIGSGNSNSIGNQGLNAASGLLGQSSYADASVAISYLLSPRTSIGASVDVNRGLSSLGQSYSTNAQVHLSRSLTEWWRFGGFGGVGFSGGLQNISTFTSPRPTGGFDTTIVGNSQSLTVSAAATIGDIYAIGTSRTYVASATYGYHLPGLRWSFFVDAAEYQTSSNTGQGAFGTWTASAGMNKALSDHVFLGISGHYANYQGQLLNNLAAASGSTFAPGFSNQAYSGVQISLSWAPANLKW